MSRMSKKSSGPEACLSQGPANWAPSVPHGMAWVEIIENETFQTGIVCVLQGRRKTETNAKGSLS